MYSGCSYNRVPIHLYVLLFNFPQAYTPKRCILIQVLPPFIAYIKISVIMHVFIMPNPFVICSCIYAFWLELQLDTQCVYLVYAFRSNCNIDAYMHELTTKDLAK